MGRRKRQDVRSVGVTMELGVIRYLDGVADQERRDRSFVVNCIVKEHAERHGQRIDAGCEGGDEQAA